MTAYWTNILLRVTVPLNIMILLSYRLSPCSHHPFVQSYSVIFKHLGQCRAIISNPSSSRYSYNFANIWGLHVSETDTFVICPYWSLSTHYLVGMVYNLKHLGCFCNQIYSVRKILAQSASHRLVLKIYTASVLVHVSTHWSV